MAVLSSFFDESGKFEDHKVVSFCGVCATPPALREFDEDWNGLLRRANLPFLTMKQALRHHRKLGPAIPKQSIEQRISVLAPFAQCIRDHIELGVVIQIDVQGYKLLSAKAIRSIGNSPDPYYPAFFRALTELSEYVGGDDKVSFICDDGEDTALNCYKFYRRIRKLDPSWKRRLVSLSFANDEEFPALQAADMLSSLARLEARRFFYREHHDYRPLADHLFAESVPGGIQWRQLRWGKQELQLLSDKLDRIPPSRH